jgi:hypothetical protein
MLVKVMRVLSFIILNFKIAASLVQVRQLFNGVSAAIGEGYPERKVQASIFTIIITNIAKKL